VYLGHKISCKNDGNVPVKHIIIGLGGPHSLKIKMYF